MITIEVRGPAKSGKSTVLSLIAGMLRCLGCDVQVITSGPVIAEWHALDRLEHEPKPAVTIQDTRDEEQQ
jgi:hypothetical protein